MSPALARKTQYAPAERASPETLKAQTLLLQQLASVQVVLDAVPEPLMILNSCRQLVYFNRALLNFVQAKDGAKIIGLRPGELMNCMHSRNTAAGCGTTQYCRVCGAVNSILAAQEGQENDRLCRILTLEENKVGALTLRVHSSPFSYLDNNFTILMVSDNRDAQHREAMERIFFHDIFNTVSALQCTSFLISTTEAKSSEEIHSIISLAPRVEQLSEELADELRSFQQLLAAENHDLMIEMARFQSLELLQKVVETYTYHKLAQGKQVFIAPDSVNVSLENDPVLMRRVVGNMLKNALEATPPAGTVKLGCTSENEKVTFWVQNPGVMPQDVQLQVFQRYYSTKGKGRGLGTYSMKLLTENYLGGKIFFQSKSKSGTRFWAVFPLQRQEDDSSIREIQLLREQEKPAAQSG